MLVTGAGGRTGTPLARAQHTTSVHWARRWEQRCSAAHCRRCCRCCRLSPAAAGKLVLQKLRERPAEFAAVKGLVRRPEQQQELGEGAVLGDVLHPHTWEAELAGCTHLVM